MKKEFLFLLMGAAFLCFPADDGQARRPHDHTGVAFQSRPDAAEIEPAAGQECPAVTGSANQPDVADTAPSNPVPEKIVPEAGKADEEESKMAVSPSDAAAVLTPADAKKAEKSALEEAQDIGSADTASTAPMSACVKGLPAAGTEKLHFFHNALQTGWNGAAGEVYLEKTSGAVSYRGQLYRLALVTILNREFRPLSGVSFPMSIRLDYMADDLSHVTVDVPVKEGADNLAFEKILSAREGAVDPADFLPADHNYAIWDHCVDKPMRIEEIIMTTPIEISAGQIDRFAQKYASANP